MFTLEGMATAHKEKLNWKTSVVDLMTLLGVDASLVTRQELMTELGCSTPNMRPAQMNGWGTKQCYRNSPLARATFLKERGS